MQLTKARLDALAASTHVEGDETQQNQLEDYALIKAACGGKEPEDIAGKVFNLPPAKTGDEDENSRV